MQDISERVYGDGNNQLAIYIIKILHFNHRIGFMSNTFTPRSNTAATGLCRDNSGSYHAVGPGRQAIMPLFQRTRKDYE